MTPDGREVTATATRGLEDGSKAGSVLLSYQRAKKPGQKSTRAVREFHEDKVVQTIEIIGSGTTTVQEYRRIK